jgi:hypothetical protein
VTAQPRSSGQTTPDQVSIARLRRVLRDHFAEIPLLEAHLALLDSRGVLYATHACDLVAGELNAEPVSRRQMFAYHHSGWS